MSHLEDSGAPFGPSEIASRPRPNVLWPSSQTMIAGVVGFPVRHSLSPRLHNAAYAAMGLDWCYLAFEVPPGSLERAVAGAAALGVRGLSVTMPHKDAAARLATRHSRQVRRLGAANTLVFEPGAIRAESCDGDGLLDDLRQGAGFDPRGHRCAVIGAGGAARAAVLALAEAGAAEIVIVNRTATRAWKAVALAPRIARVGRPEELKGADLVVQATPIGMPGADLATQERGLSVAGSHGSFKRAPKTGSLAQGSRDLPVSPDVVSDPALVPERGVLGVFGFRRPAEPSGESSQPVSSQKSGLFGSSAPALGTSSEPKKRSVPSWAETAAPGGSGIVAGVDPSWFGPGQLVVDLVYDPVRTPFLIQAERNGATVRTGLGMLIHQAARQIVFWTGAAPPLEVMWKVVRELPG